MSSGPGHTNLNPHKIPTAHKFAVPLVYLDDLAARYLARHAQEFNTSRTEPATRPKLFRDHHDFLVSEDARYARETKPQYNVSDPPILPTSPKTSGTASLCSGSGRPSVTPPDVIDIDDVDQEILWHQLPELPLSTAPASPVTSDTDEVYAEPGNFCSELPADSQRALTASADIIERMQALQLNSRATTPTAHPGEFISRIPDRWHEGIPKRCTTYQTVALKQPS